LIGFSYNNVDPTGKEEGIKVDGELLMMEEGEDEKLDGIEG
jgi:hypothetical protein